MLAKLGDAFSMSGEEESLLITPFVVVTVCTAAVIALLIVVVLMLKKRKATFGREFTDLTVGGGFSCEGLRIVAKYMLEPKEGTLSEYKVVTKKSLRSWKPQARRTIATL